MGPELCKTLEIRLECIRVCVYVWNSVLKGQNVLSIPFLFYSLFTGIGQNWVKLLYFLQNYLCHIYLCLLQ